MKRPTAIAMIFNTIVTDDTLVAAGTILAAAFAGNIAVIPFDPQQKGRPLCEPLFWYDVLREGECHIYINSHVTASDPFGGILGQEPRAVMGDENTSIKVFMTYGNLLLNERERLEVMDAGRDSGAFASVYAEDYDGFRHRTDKLEKAGKIADHNLGLSDAVSAVREVTHHARYEYTPFGRFWVT